jgi:hypothetical protein
MVTATLFLYRGRARVLNNHSDVSHPRYPRKSGSTLP